MLNLPDITWKVYLFTVVVFVIFNYIEFFKQKYAHCLTPLKTLCWFYKCAAFPSERKVGGKYCLKLRTVLRKNIASRVQTYRQKLNFFLVACSAFYKIPLQYVKQIFHPFTNIVWFFMDCVIWHFACFSIPMSTPKW